MNNSHNTNTANNKTSKYPIDKLIEMSREAERNLLHYNTIKDKKDKLVLELGAIKYQHEQDGKAIGELKELKYYIEELLIIPLGSLKEINELAFLFKREVDAKRTYRGQVEQLNKDLTKRDAKITALKHSHEGCETRVDSYREKCAIRIKIYKAKASKANAEKRKLMQLMTDHPKVEAWAKYEKWQREQAKKKGKNNAK